MVQKIVIKKPGKRKIKLKIRDGVGLVVVEGKEKGIYEVDFNIVLEKKNKGKVLVRGVVKNEVDLKVMGLVVCNKGVGEGEFFLEMKFLMLGEGGLVWAEPKLEIEGNGVKVGHGMSISSIDEREIGYLMSRGIERTKAEEMIVKGFLGGTI